MNKIAKIIACLEKIEIELTLNGEDFEKMQEEVYYGREDETSLLSLGIERGILLFHKNTLQTQLRNCLVGTISNN